jgi:hypothetical protein
LVDSHSSGAENALEGVSRATQRPAKEITKSGEGLHAASSLVDRNSALRSGSMDMSNLIFFFVLSFLPALSLISTQLWVFPRSGLAIASFHQTRRACQNPIVFLSWTGEIHGTQAGDTPDLEITHSRLQRAGAREGAGLTLQGCPVLASHSPCDVLHEQGLQCGLG